MVIVAASFSRSSQAPEHMAAHVGIPQWGSAKWPKRIKPGPRR